MLKHLKQETNYTYTENGGVTHKSTQSALLDMFAMGAAMRNRADAEIILMFRKAYKEDPLYALKCLFYIRDIEAGQGERRFFRLCIHDLADRHPEVVRRNLEFIPMFGRYDDLYSLLDTRVENDVWDFISKQLMIDFESKTPSLLGKWLKSENASSKESRALARRTREALGLSSKDYRKMLSRLRKKINVLERLMSAGEWDKIEFDKIPSVAGLKYKNAFARHDVERIKKGKVSYESFMKDEETKVNTKALYPYEIVCKAVGARTQLDRNVANKYWENYLENIDSFKLNGIAVVDTSGSMTYSYHQSVARPIDVAISLGMICAEKCQGPYHGHYISFSSKPQLIEVEGIDFCDKVKRIYDTNLMDNTNIEGVFDLILDTALKYHCSQEEIPENIIIISDMEFDACAKPDYYRVQRNFTAFNQKNINTELEKIRHKWRWQGYRLPKLIFWNVNSRQNNIPMLGQDVSFVSGMSPSIFSVIATGKTGRELMLEKLNSSRYDLIS